MNLFKEEEKEALKAFKTLYTKRLFIVVFTLGLGFTALAISYFILPKKYLSEAIIYPTPSNSQEMILENPSFGFEGHANQLLQVLQSSALKDRMIKEFGLITYYEIDSTEKAWYSKLSKKMEKDIQFERTPYYSVSITAETESPELSANIVNYTVDEVNVIMQEIFEANIQSTFRAIQTEYLQKEKYVKNLLDSLIQRKESNTTIALSHLNTQLDITHNEISQLKKQLHDLENTHSIYAYSEQMNLLSNQVANASARYNHSRAQYEELKEVMNPRDTFLLKLKGEMLGARKNADTARAQLELLKAVNSEYAQLNLLLQNNFKRYSELQGQKQQLENAYEPTINSVGLSSLENELHFAQEQMQILQTRYERARNKAENKLPSIYVISRGRPSYQKSSPSYAKSTLLGLTLGLVFSTGWVLGRERWKRLRKQLQEST